MSVRGGREEAQVWRVPRREPGWRLATPEEWLLTPWGWST